MKTKASKTLPIVVELKKRHWHLYTLSIFNMSLIQFLDLLEHDLQIKGMQILNKEENGELKELSFSNAMKLEAVKELSLHKVHEIKSIHIQLEENTDIDSNFNDEVYIHFFETFDLQLLLSKIISITAGPRKLIIPPRKNSFCIEIYKGKIHQFDSLDQYVKGRHQGLS